MLAHDVPIPLPFAFEDRPENCNAAGGLGFGLTRMLMVMLKKRNIREVRYVLRAPTAARSR